MENTLSRMMVTSLLCSRQLFAERVQICAEEPLYGNNRRLVGVDVMDDDRMTVKQLKEILVKGINAECAKPERRDLVNKQVDVEAPGNFWNKEGVHDGTTVKEACGPYHPKNKETGHDFHPWATVNVVLKTMVDDSPARCNIL